MSRPADAPPPVLALLYAPAGSALVERGGRLLVAVPEAGDRVVLSQADLLAEPDARAVGRLLALVA
ncbi:hypothetical protein [Streptomonospora wellingtoniae]|uniref:Uncharacterized protein n=1 Tax=Streptomonospora wellingtoniae TaxID=3075544 RepID=A0ABU2KU89_9ACTN|nr:hypothetical protein [Streptomonospora sp. DSM 45055]MDT0302870.1 hypothetical protein [Streptomonospora sp. DSM 45055]